MSRLAPTLVPLGYQALAIDTTAGGFALTVPAGATRVWLQAENVDGRWRDDGTNPTTTVGAVIWRSGGSPAVDNSFLYDGDLSAFKVIASANSGTLHCRYYA